MTIRAFRWLERVNRPRIVADKRQRFSRVHSQPTGFEADDSRVLVMYVDPGASLMVARGAELLTDVEEYLFSSRIGTISVINRIGLEEADQGGRHL
jgi:hypothetical protein